MKDVNDLMQAILEMDAAQRRESEKARLERSARLAALDEQKQKNKPVIVFALITSIISWIDSMNWLGSNGNIPIPFKADICGAPTHPISALLTGCGNALPDYAHCKYLMQFGTQAGVATRHGTSITAKVFATRARTAASW